MEELERNCEECGLPTTQNELEHNGIYYFWVCRLCLDEILNNDYEEESLDDQRRF